MGSLYILALSTTRTQMTDLSISYLGQVFIEEKHRPHPSHGLFVLQVSACSSAVYLGFDMLYLGSSQGDSYMARLDLQNSASPFTVVDEYPNLAPITDFCIYDLDKQGRVSPDSCP